ncbi:MAG: hypothetical protein ACJAX2_001153 [Celeribacter sp.]|jgi:hypothetical protein
MYKDLKMMRLTKSAVILAATIGSVAPAFAMCAGNQVEVFSCSFGTKQVELCLTPDEQNLTYRFGPKGAPELELTRGYGDITLQPWNGIGRSIWEQVTIPKGQFSYVLYASFDKFDQTQTGGLDVMRGDQRLATLTCTNAGTQNGLFELDTLRFAMTDAGYCRRDTNEALQMGPCA